ncbi:hypothetical protein [Arcicella rigui]|uniref:Uncharacterized protein n=1 Tax=Arcicella rigui TaxID=797020 RepID=A0ABU5QCV6_9BACT|nr:hypothetical protein [Arcicella rigui]MEA5140492.1 hypothetical protein [Arcicella rigui]
MAIEIVDNYKSLVANIGQLIEVSGYRNDYIAHKIGISPTTFSVKKGRGSFSLDDIEKIIKVIENEDVENYLMLEIMKSRKDDENVPYSEAKKLLGWK